MANKKSKYPQRLRRAYYNMKGRCYDSKTNGYKYYGGKGVTVCKEWLNNRDTFCEWALDNGYEDSLTLDRIETEGIYEPSNCRWITHEKQQNNRTDNIFVDIDNETKTLGQWSQETGVDWDTLKRRFKDGKDILEDDSRNIKVEINGEIKTLKELSEQSGILYSTIFQRYCANWKSEDLLKPLETNETKLIEINGEIHTVTEWAEISGLTREIILNRISYGWKTEDLLKPKLIRNNKKYIEIDGQSHTIDEWCKIAGIKKNSFYVRMKKGLTGQDLISSNNKK